MVKSIIKRKIGKRGQIQSVAIMMVGIFVIALTVILMRKVVTEFYKGMDEAGINTPVMTQVETEMTAQAKNFDYGVVIMTILFIAALIVTSFMIPTHPIFIVINVLGIFFLVFLGMVLTNVYGEIVSGEGSELGDAADNYPLITSIMIYLPYIGAIAILLTSIVMYVRGSQG